MEGILNGNWYNRNKLYNYLWYNINISDWFMWIERGVKIMDIESIFLEQMKQNILSMIGEGSFTRSQEKDLKLAKYYIEKVLNTTKEDSYDYQ